MYFAILGKNPGISVHELSYSYPTNIKKNKDIITFDCKYPERLSQLAGLIKRGHIVNDKELTDILHDTKLLGIADMQIAKELKKDYKIKRFKICAPGHTDRDLVKQGTELIKIDNTYGLVQGYQNIPLYEAIDFEKPGRDMHMGMMPSKLTHILINIGLNYLSNTTKPYIYDPFCGSGTTLFLANHMGYPTLGSDIDSKYIQTNTKRRSQTRFATSQAIDYFQHDITQTIPPSQHRPCTLMITEGRLGPIVYKDTPTEKVQSYASKVLPIYKAAIKQAHQAFAKIPMVFTLPYYLAQQISISSQIQELAAKLDYQTTVLQDIYHRPKQNVGRQIVILHQKS